MYVFKCFVRKLVLKLFKFEIIIFIDCVKEIKIDRHILHEPDFIMTKLLMELHRNLKGLKKFRKKYMHTANSILYELCLLYSDSNVL